MCTGAEALIAIGLATTAASTGVALATRPSLPKVETPMAPPPPPPAAATPPPAPTETDIGAATKRQRDVRQFGLARTILARGSTLGPPGQLSLLGPGTPTLGG